MGPIRRLVTKRGWDDVPNTWRAQDVLKRSHLHSHLPREGLLLDLGAGLGYVAEAVLQDAPARRCVTMDPISAVSPRVARRMAQRVWHPTRGSAIHLPFKDESFDGAWAGFMLHHVLREGQEAILQEVRRVLRRGAVFALLEDTPSNEREAATTLMADRRLNAEPAEAPHHYRSPDQWRADLQGHGFVIEHEVAFTRMFPPATLRAVHHRSFFCRRR